MRTIIAGIMAWLAAAWISGAVWAQAERGAPPALSAAATGGVAAVTAPTLWPSATGAVLLASAPDAARSAAEPRDRTAPVGPVLTVQQAWAYGGWVMWALAAVAVLALIATLRLLKTLQEGSVVPRGLLSEVMDRIRAGEINEAGRLCENRPCPLSAIAIKTFDFLRRSPRGGGGMLLREIVVAEGDRQADLLTARVHLLRDLAAVAGLLGLLGGVLGLLRVFAPAAGDANAASAAVQAGGVMKALVACAWALFVVIPIMTVRAWMRRRLVRCVAALHSAAAEIGMAVAGKFDR